MEQLGVAKPELVTDSNVSTGSSSFLPPVVFDDVEVAEFEARQAAMKRMERLQRSGIPTAYRSASIENCPPEIRDYAASFDEQTSHGLVIRGDVGVGKTYAGCAILNHVAGLCTVRFAAMGDILLEIRGTFSNLETEADIIGKYRGVRLLMLDDLGKERPTAFALERMFSIIDGRYRAGKPTIVTTQYPAQQLAERLASAGEFETAEAVVSRLMESKAVVLNGPDRRMKL